MPHKFLLVCWNPIPPSFLFFLYINLLKNKTYFKSVPFSFSQTFIPLVEKLFIHTRILHWEPSMLSRKHETDKIETYALI